MALRYRECLQFLAEIGAEITGVLPSAEWSDHLEAGGHAARSILIFGAGGPAFIHRYEAFAREHGELEHWLSDYAERLFEAWHGGPSSSYLNPYRSGLRFPFQRAAVAAGIGVMGLNHVVLTPDWGPWFSLLGAILVEEAVEPTGPSGYDPCGGCPAPCLLACPSGAVSREGYDGHRCLQTKLEHPPCLHACPARHACVVRSDLRREMVQLESARHRDDEATRALFRSFLQEREGATGT